jgi:hypothetical protein
MKPFKSGQTIAHWLLRLSLVVYIALLFIPHLYPINLNNFHFYLAVAISILGVLILMGGFIVKPTLTVLSGLGILLISGYLFVKGFTGVISHSTMLYLIPSVLGFYFFTKGNKA